MIKRLRKSPSIIYGTIALAIAILFFMFYSFGIDNDAVVEGYKSSIYTVNREAAVETIQQQVTSIQNSINSSNATSVADADVEKIINMSETEVWKLISEGKYSSYASANSDAQKNWSECKKFWKGMLVSVEVPAWKWKDNSHKKKVSSKVTITVNKHLSEYFKAYMTDLYNLPEKYVIVTIGGYDFRSKNNGTGTSALSGHSFGATLDINYWLDGMSSVPAGNPSIYGVPYNTSKGLKEPQLSTCCTFDNSWFKLAMKYKLDWGGNWSYNSLDPMHFSLVGDRNKDTRLYKPKTSGRNP